MIALFIIGAVILTAAAILLPLRFIPTIGEHAGPIDWTPAPRYRDLMPDRLDRLASRYTIPRPLLEELLRTDRLIANVDAFLGPVTR